MPSLALALTFPMPLIWRPALLAKRKMSILTEDDDFPTLLSVMMLDIMNFMRPILG